MAQEEPYTQAMGDPPRITFAVDLALDTSATRVTRLGHQVHGVQRHGMTVPDTFVRLPQGPPLPPKPNRSQRRHPQQ